MLYRRLRAEAGSGEAIGRRGNGVQRGRCIADINALSTGRSEAMTHWGDGSSANALSQMSTRCSRAEARRWIAEATGLTRMLHRRCQRVEHVSQ
jgi:hypothetical protein